MDNITKISQTELKEILKTRIQNKEAFIDKPLIIWRSYLEDGIQKRILEEVLEELNVDRSESERVWYKEIHPESFLVSDLTATTILPDFHIKDERYRNHKVALTVTGFLQKPESNILNKFHQLIAGKVHKDDSPIVAFINYKEKEIESTEKFPNAVHYIFEPDYEEWAEWARKEKNMPTYIIDFIRGDGKKEGIIYRWYNWFNNYNSELKINPPGCVYPQKWIDILKIIKRLPSKTDITEKDFYRIDTLSGISSDVKDDFKNYIKKRNVNK